MARSDRNGVEWSGLKYVKTGKDNKKKDIKMCFFFFFQRSKLCSLSTNSDSEREFSAASDEDR